MSTELTIVSNFKVFVIYVPVNSRIMRRHDLQLVHGYYMTRIFFTIHILATT